MVKKDNVGEFIDCDEISILNKTTLIKDNFGLLKFFIATSFKPIFIVFEMFYDIITITSGIARGTASDWHPWM